MSGLFETKQALMEFAIVCVSEYERRKSKKKGDLITQRTAYSEFGEGWVKNAVSDCLLRGKKMGPSKNSPVYFSRTEILAVKAAESLNKLGIEVK